MHSLILPVFGPFIYEHHKFNKLAQAYFEDNSTDFLTLVPDIIFDSSHPLLAGPRPEYPNFINIGGIISVQKTSTLTKVRSILYIPYTPNILYYFFF